MHNEAADLYELGWARPDGAPAPCPANPDPTEIFFLVRDELNAVSKNCQLYLVIFNNGSKKILFRPFVVSSRDKIISGIGIIRHLAVQSFW